MKNSGFAKCIANDVFEAVKASDVKLVCDTATEKTKKKLAEDIIQIVFDTAAKKINDGEVIIIQDFGRLYKKTIPSRHMVNPLIKGEIVTKAKEVVALNNGHNFLD